MKNAMNEGTPAEALKAMMMEFYRIIRHKSGIDYNITKKLLSSKQDLCQLIRDMLNVCETSMSSPSPSSLAKYWALRCKLQAINPNSEEFCNVQQQVLKNNHSDCPVKILQIYRVGRISETAEFLSNLGNIQSLFHASSVCNFVGILSRGLLLPKIVVENHGLERTDIGNLGSGIYFSDSISTSVKYSSPSEMDGTRLLAVCNVALGTCLDVYKKDVTLTSAPPGYDSVHGVRKTENIYSDFEDDEFVVYKTCQVKMRYIVKFCLVGDQVKQFQPGIETELEKDRPVTSHCHLQLKDYALPSLNLLNPIKTGLQDTSGNPVPLEDIHVKGRIMDFIAQIVVFQTYINQNDNPIEAKYVFPLDDTAAVCGFEAFINGKHIVGEVKEKEQAHKEYREAISRGDGAYLMDQDAPDVFTVSVGNLPPKTTVLIKITYITELSFQNGCMTFKMPAAVAPWQQDKALNENTQDTVKKVCVKRIGTKKGGFCVVMSIEMPYSIELIHSLTHKLKIKKTDCKAVIKTVENSSLDISGFSLEIWISHVYLPRMWVEKHPDKESEACMLVFQPKFETNFKGIQLSREIIICLDCSNSMEGSTLQQAKHIAVHALQMSCFIQRVNVIRFGTNFTEFSSFSKNITSDLASVKEFIISATPTMGNTDLWKTLHYLSLLYPSQGERNILLISDGHIQNESMTFQIVKKNVTHTRLFTCGVGSTANHHMLRTLSQYGAGAYEYFDPKSKYNWLRKIESQTSRIYSPGCSSVSIKWQQFDSNAPEPLQAPTQIQSLFNNERLLVYGFIPHCTQATLNALINDQALQAMISTTELQKTTGTLLHKLTARALIRDYENGILHENETEHEMKKHTLKVLIINLSMENSIITQFTSFVAVEKRDITEVQHSGVPNIPELIAKEDTDFLPYMDWEPKTSGHEYMSSNRAVGFGRCESVTTATFLSGQLGEGGDSTDNAQELGVMLFSSAASHSPKGDTAVLNLFGWQGAETGIHRLEHEQFPSQAGLSDCFLTRVEEQLQCLQCQSDKVSIPLVKPCISPDSTRMSFNGAANVEYSAGATEVGLFGSVSKPQPEFSPHSQKSLSKISIPKSLACGDFHRHLLAPNRHRPPPPPLPPKFIPGLCLHSLCSFTPSSLKKTNFEAQDTPEVLALKLAGEAESPILHTAPKSGEQLHCELSKVSRSLNSALPFSAIENAAKTRRSCSPFHWTSASTDTEKKEDLGIRACRRKQLSKIVPQMKIQQSPPSAVTWTMIFELQNQDGFWNLSPELGVLLDLDVDYLINNFLPKKGIWSLGPKGREVLQLIATLLVLQFIRYKRQLEGITFKSLMKLDDSPTSSAIPWAFASVKKAVEWVRRVDRQFPAICHRLELGKDWDSATKKLLGIELISTNLPPNI